MPRETTVAKAVLLAKVKANRDGHREKFLRAQAGYREAMINLLDAQLAEARAGRDVDLSALVRLPKPEDHTDDYDLAIEMLGMEVGKNVTIGEKEFDNLVRDRWMWSQAFAGTIQAYGVS